MTRRRTIFAAVASSAGVALAVGAVVAVAFAPAVANAGIVQCDPTQGTKLVTCDLCALYAQLQTIINIAAGGLVGFGVLAFVVGGLRYVTSAGNPELIAKAKKTVQFAIAGIIVTTLAFVLVQAVFTTLSGNTGGIFSGIQCQLPEPSGGPSTPPPPPPTTGPPTKPPPGGADCQGTVGGCKDSPALSQFMSCFESQLSGLVNLGGKNTYGDGHRAGSCHYGGKTCTDGSHAVDYAGDGGAPSFSAADAALIQSAINICGSQVGGAAGRGEDNGGNQQPGPYNGISAPGTTHVHINVANQACGCN